MRGWRSAVVLLATAAATVGVLALSGCGGSDDTGSTPTQPSQNAAATSTSEDAMEHQDSMKQG